MSVNESYPVFQCPKCRQYISTKYDACRFCSFPLTDEIKTQAVEKEVDGNREFRLKTNKAILYSGFGVFGLGAALSAISISTIFFNRGEIFFPWSPVIVVVGLGQILYGFSGVREERKK